MADLILNNIYLVLLLPLWIFLIIMVGRFFSVYVNPHIMYFLSILTSVFGAILCTMGLFVFSGSTILETQIPFLKIKNFIISAGLHIDKQALIFAFVLYLISTCVLIFSINHLKEEKKKYRFYALINLFNFTLTGFFFSPNLFQSYFFWEIAGIISYLLIGFDYQNTLKSIAAKKVLILNRIGDMALLGGIVLSAYYMHSYVENINFTTLSYVDMNAISTFMYAYTDRIMFLFICLLFVLAVIVKSAQIPFYTWLQDAMEAKLPVSALLHSSTLVALGIFLTLRLLPMFTFEPVVLKLIAIIGVITAVICSFCAITQNNNKKLLAYSTSAQLGLVFYAIGVLNIKAAIILFIAHAFIKSLLFLSLPQENQKWNYLKMACFAISGLSLAGILFSGFIAKSLIFKINSTITCTYLLLIALCLTAFYVVKIIYTNIKNCGLTKENSSVCEILACGLLLLCNVGFFIYLIQNQTYKITTSFYILLFVCILAFVMYFKNWLIKIPVMYEISYNGFYLDKIYCRFVAKIYYNISKLLTIIDNKIFDNYSLLNMSCRILIAINLFIEEKIVNKSVTEFAKFCSRFSKFNRYLQTKNVQNYNAYAFIIITIILTGLVLAYNPVLSFLYERIN